MSSRLLVGMSTGALTTGDPAPAVATILAAGADVIELSALHEQELPHVEALVRDEAAVGGLPHAVHAPVKGRQLPEGDLVARLAALDVPVVAHPDGFARVALWRTLGSALLIENTDGRKPAGQRPATLDAVFTQLPHARFCLDVSHALDAGGPSLVATLARRYRTRLAAIHIGCRCGHGGPDALPADALAALATLPPVATDTPLPVIVERSGIRTVGQARELLDTVRRTLQA